ncbi:MAG TPA: hypothetical protein VNF71_14705 [Acidimicrobiales bacterium]|nr:hypothetical protein [Acidimicrobiales bacterium]
MLPYSVDAVGQPGAAGGGLCSGGLRWDDNFEPSRTAFEALVGFLDGVDAATLTHAELEERIRADGFELLRLLLQDHLDLRAGREERLEEVVGADGITRAYAEDDHQRPLVTIFGEVRVARLAYRRKGAPNLHPADAGLNLPGEVYSHGLRQVAATEAARGSFDEAVAAIDRTTAAKVPKRQVEALTQAAAVDFEAFFDIIDRPAADTDQVVVVSADGKGIVISRTQSSFSARPSCVTRAERTCFQR